MSQLHEHTQAHICTHAPMYENANANIQYNRSVLLRQLQCAALLSVPDKAV